MAGVVAYGTYVPSWRLERSALAGGGRGTRAVASYDEDATSMGVEAARLALAATSVDPDVVVFATASPPYADKTNASTIHAALALPDRVGAYDMAGAARSASGALRLALSSSLSTLVVAGDVRTGLPGGADESQGGDAAAAFVCAPASSAPALAEVAGTASSSVELLDRWRAPGDVAARVWEERFGESAYVPAAESAITDACKQAGIAVDAVDHLVVAGLHARAVRSLVRRTGVATAKVADDLTARLGNTGSAHLGLMLAHVLDEAGPDETVLAVHLADGADAVVLRTTAALSAHRERRVATVAAQVAAGRTGLPYDRFLAWRGLLEPEPPRRPDPEAPAAPVTFRREPWKFGFTASRCEVCGTRHLPPSRVCLECRSVDRMADERLADARGTVATFTVDHLAHSPSPPVVAAVIDFDGGGRLLCEMTDVAPDDVAVGTRVAMTFRRLYTAPNGVHNYFWKARPIRARPEEAG
jgi:3-hydroxy-3-methylglutaryl CoA synthase/uncharacterized OB-fold protein